MAHLHQVASRIVLIMAAVIAPQVSLGGTEHDQPGQGRTASVPGVFPATGVYQLVQAVIPVHTGGIAAHIAVPGGGLCCIADTEHIAHAIVGIGHVL